MLTKFTGMPYSKKAGVASPHRRWEDIFFEKG